MVKKNDNEIENKSNNIAKALSLLNKKFGDGAVMTFNDTAIKKVEAISTGSLSLDLALGVGGLPLGRAVEIYGPESSGKSTICMQVCAQAQKQGYNVAYLDLENAFDPIYAKNLGIDLNNMLFSQPASGEEAFQIMETLLKEKLVNVIIFDSIAAARTNAEVNGEVGDNFIGRQAKLMSDGLKKITPLANAANCLCIFTNQLRMKIGVMFGCFTYNTRVCLADGTTEKIGKMVNSDKEYFVKSYNLETKKIENKKVIRKYNNGEFLERFKVTAKKLKGNGIAKITVADDHTFITPNGEKHLSELKVNDRIYVSSLDFKNDMLESFIIGSILGDGGIKSLKSKLSHRLAFTHSLTQGEYCDWKYNLLPDWFISCKYITKKGLHGFETINLPHLNKYITCKKKKDCRLTQEFIDNITPFALAIWYLDDGTFSGNYERYGHGKSTISAKHLTDEDLLLVANRIEELGFPRPTITKSKRLLWSGKNNEAFQTKIASYVPSCMKYKINPRIAVSGDSLPKIETELFETVAESEILTIEKLTTNTRSPFKYDLQIEDNSNYFVDNILVHNSPETTPGGEAMKFYASVRMRISRVIKPIEGKGEAIGNETKVKIVKNKVAPPFREAVFDIIYNKGVDVDKEILDMAVRFGFIQKAGAWFKYGEEKFQGKNGVAEWLAENPETKEKLLNNIKTALLHAPTDDKNDNVEDEMNDTDKFDSETGEILE